MPIYRYESEDGQFSIECHRAVADCKKPIVMRLVLPRRVSVRVPTGVTQDASWDREIKKERHKQELREGSRFRSSFTKNQIAKIYKED